MAKSVKTAKYYRNMTLGLAAASVLLVVLGIWRYNSGTKGELWGRLPLVVVCIGFTFYFGVKWRSSKGN